MALKDITLGQYFPGNTVIHRLDPRTKLLLTVLYITALFLGKHLVSYAVLAAILVVWIRLSRIKLSTIFRGIKPILFLLVFTGLINIFYTPGDILWQFGFLKVTEQGLWSALFMVLRILMLIACTCLLTYTTSPILLTDGLESLLSPLKKLHAPIHELTMMMSIALRFIPTLIEETDKIISAQKARGAEFDTGSLMDKARALIPLLVPLFISAFRRADELAIAMECRCYHGGDGRTRLRELRYKGADWTALCIGLFLCVGVGVLGHFGL